MSFTQCAWLRAQGAKCSWGDDDVSRVCPLHLFRACGVNESQNLELLWFGDPLMNIQCNQ